MNFKPLSSKHASAGLLWLILFPGLLLLMPFNILAQSHIKRNVTHLLQQLQKSKQDTGRFSLLVGLAQGYADEDRNKSLQYATQEQQLANSLNYTEGQIQAFEDLGFATYNFGKFKQELDFFKQGYALAAAHHLDYLKYQLLMDMGYGYEHNKNYTDATKSFSEVTMYYLKNKKNKISPYMFYQPSKKELWFDPANSAMFDYSFYLKDTSSSVALCRQILDKQLQDKDASGIKAALEEAVWCYRRFNPAKALRYAQQEIQYFKPGDTTDTYGSALILAADLYATQKDYTRAMEYYRKATALKPGTNSAATDDAALGMSYIYTGLEDYASAQKLLLQQYKRIGKPDKLSDRVLSVYGPLINNCIKLKAYSAALTYSNELIRLIDKANNRDIKAAYLHLEAEIYYRMHRYDEAMHAVKESLALNPEEGDRYEDYNWLGVITRDAPDVVLKKYGIDPAQRYPLAIKNLRLALDFYQQRGWAFFAKDQYKELSTTYELVKDYKNFHDTYKLYIAARDSSINRSNQLTFVNKLADIEHQKKEEQLKYQQGLINQKVAQQKKYYLSGIIVLLAIALLIAWNYRNQRKANLQLSKQQQEIARQRDELIATVSNLEKTQKQLIQSEKMASLGELTAGIAHEIQNPLNFVNNFSEVSIELLTELKEEIAAGHQDDVLAIANDLTQNLDKIHHHGKRADNIVKGMLEHSRTSTGQKEPTDMNKLADEYLRLAYHGLRAKDKSFNAELVTNFDANLTLVNVIPQDIGRVLLNLFNNAFYATQQKQKTAGPGYNPRVEIKTFAPASGEWGATVTDNGNGISESIKDKIMQPFFTTKPTGEGTGLGLSLSYDIVVKGHGGKIDVKSSLGVGTEFTIQIPTSG